MATRFSDLPSPEERILKSVHASQGKVEQSSLGILVPVLPSVPECAIRVQGRVSRDTVQVETTIVDTIAVFSANGDTELGLTEKKSIKLWTKKRQANGGAPRGDASLPGTGVRGPSAPHLTIWSSNVYGIGVGLAVKREVWMSVDGDSIGIG